MNVDLKISGRVESLHLEPGDRVLVTLDTDRNHTMDQLVRVREELVKHFPDNDILILDGIRIAKETA